jgi:hypothetical protein
MSLLLQVFGYILNEVEFDCENVAMLGIVCHESRKIIQYVQYSVNDMQSHLHAGSGS